MIPAPRLQAEFDLRGLVGLRARVFAPSRPTYVLPALGRLSFPVNAEFEAHRARPSSLLQTYGASLFDGNAHASKTASTGSRCKLYGPSHRLRCRPVRGDSTPMSPTAGIHKYIVGIPPSLLPSPHTQVSHSTNPSPVFARPEEKYPRDGREEEASGRGECILGRSGEAAGRGWWRKCQEYVACSIWSGDVVPTDVGRTGRPVEVQSSRLGRRPPWQTNASTTGASPFMRQHATQKDPVKFTTLRRYFKPPHEHITNVKSTAYKLASTTNSPSTVFRSTMTTFSWRCVYEAATGSRSMDGCA